MRWVRTKRFGRFEPRHMKTTRFLCALAVLGLASACSSPADPSNANGHPLVSDPNSMGGAASETGGFPSAGGLAPTAGGFGPATGGFAPTTGGFVATASGFPKTDSAIVGADGAAGGTSAKNADSGGAGGAS